MKFLLLMFFAAATLCKAESAPSDSPEKALLAVQLLQALPEPDAAAIEQAYQQLVATYPNHPDIRVAYGDYFFDLKNQPSALAQWRTALRLAPEHADALSRLGGFILNYEGDAPRAADYFARALVSAPDNAQFHRDLATVLALFRHELHGQFGADSEAVLLQSLSHYQKAVQLEPANLDAARDYAETFYMLQHPDWAAARAAWEHATNLMPAKDYGWLNLARVSLKLGDKEAAAQYLSRVENPEFFGVRDKLLRRAASE